MSKISISLDNLEDALLRAKRQYPDWYPALFQSSKSGYFIGENEAGSEEPSIRLRVFTTSIEAGHLHYLRYKLAQNPALIRNHHTAAIFSHVFFITLMAQANPRQFNTWSPTSRRVFAWTKYDIPRTRQ